MPKINQGRGDIIQNPAAALAVADPWHSSTSEIVAPARSGAVENITNLCLWDMARHGRSDILTISIALHEALTVGR